MRCALVSNGADREPEVAIAPIPVETAAIEAEVVRVVVGALVRRGTPEVAARPSVVERRPAPVPGSWKEYTIPVNVTDYNIS